MRRPPPRRSRKERGVAAIEFALVAFFIMIPLAFGVSELGRAISQYNTLVKATRDAARYLTLFAPGTRTEAARCLAVYGTVSIAANGTASCSGDPLLPGLAPGNVAICEATNCPGTHHTITIPGVGAVNLVTVTIQNYQFTTLVPAIIPDITLGTVSTTMRAPL